MPVMYGLEDGILTGQLVSASLSARVLSVFNTLSCSSVRVT